MQQRTWMQGMLVVGLVLVQGAATARADFTQTFTIPLTKTNWDPTTFSSSTPPVDPLIVQKFDPNSPIQVPEPHPGQTPILTQVDLTVSYTFENQLTMQFVNPATITVSASGTMNLFQPDGKTNLVTPPTFTNSATQTATVSDVFSKTVTFPPSGYQTTTGTSKQSYSSTGSPLDQATLNQFLYNGSNGKFINLPVTASAQSTFTTNSGNGFGSSVTLAGATITVVYHYLVPEPSSLVLTGLGVMGLGTIVVKRSRVGLKKSGTV
jgi:hypothetical protein